MKFHTVTVTPRVENGVPSVGLFFQSGGMAGTGLLTEGDARAVAKALLDAIEQAKSAALADPEPDAGKGISG